MNGIAKTLQIAVNGMTHMVRHEFAARVHLVVTIGIVALGLATGLGREEWLWLVAAMGMVWAAEAFNTAFERLGDCVTLERDERIGTVKDLGAAGVMAAIIAAVVIGLLIFVPHFAVAQ